MTDAQLEPEAAEELFDHARCGETDELTTAIDAGASVNLANHNGDTLLMLAAYYGHTATVVALLERGADPNLPNNRGQTPLAGAVFKDFRETTAALLAAGADPNAGSPSAITTAALFERTACMEMFEQE